MKYLEKKRDEIFQVLSQVGNKPSSMLKAFKKIGELLEEIYSKGRKDWADELLNSEEQLNEFLNQKIKNYEKKDNRSE